MKYPVGPKTIERASKTEVGKLATLLNRVLYSADNMDVMVKGYNHDKFDLKMRKFACEDKVFKNKDPMPKSVPAHPDGDCYFATEQLMFAIRDYLEAAAIREVCE
jgi:hypothetical protein